VCVTPITNPKKISDAFLASLACYRFYFSIIGRSTRPRVS
jgi:hypothetical protein